MTETGVYEALLPIGGEVQAGLAPYLRGFTGFIVQGNLPQTWILETESETATFHVDRSGTASVLRGEGQPADLRLRWDQARLVTALLTRDRTKVPPGPPPQVTFYTGKGRRAFNFLRGRLGL